MSALPHEATLRGDFGLIRADERVAWRDCAARHLLGRMRSADGQPLPEWKIEEHIPSINRAIAAAVAQGETRLDQIEELMVFGALEKHEHAAH